MRSLAPTLAATLVAAGLLGATDARAAGEAPKFSLVLTLSPAALADLLRLKEQVTVSAMYSGEPTKEATKKGIPDEVGEVGLGNEEITRPPSTEPTTFAFAGKGFQAKRLKWVAPGTAKLLINVYSARKAADDNLLDCGIFEGTLAEAAAKPIEISCKLIGE